VHAAAITRDELEWPGDRLPATPSYELSGVVIGSGDEVYALTPFDRDGVAAEYAVVPARVLASKPARLSHVEAAALAMGGLTAWQGLFVHGRLVRGERVLVTGPSGGVGHEEVPGAIYFVVEADRDQLVELAVLVDAGELRPEVESVFPLNGAKAAAFARAAARGKRVKVVVEVGSG
jgi:NADPH:quinone reductase-like Zn-dependent oxidoreductase